MSMWQASLLSTFLALGIGLIGYGVIRFIKRIIPNHDSEWDEMKQKHEQIKETAAELLRTAEKEREWFFEQERKTRDLVALLLYMSGGEVRIPDDLRESRLYDGQIISHRNEERLETVYRLLHIN